MHFFPTALFVLLWSSGAIFSRWGLDHASPFMLLVLRFGIALPVLLVLGWRAGRWRPEPGTWRAVALAGLLMVGAYSCCYFLALQHGMTPGALATVLGVQPIATLLLHERRFGARRLAGLLLALGGVALVVFQSLVHAQLSALGAVFAGLALAAATLGAVLQKRVTQPPEQVLPLQYALSLLLCLLLLPTEPLRLDWTPTLIVALLWLGIVISVVAAVLLHRLIRAGNLVNVTSLFYLVPVGTALLDAWLLGNRMSPLAMAGMGVILAGLALVFSSARPQAAR